MMAVSTAMTPLRHLLRGFVPFLTKFRRSRPPRRTGTARFWRVSRQTLSRPSRRI